MTELSQAEGILIAAWPWLARAGLAVGMWFVLGLVVSLSAKRLRRRAERTPAKWDDVLAATIGSIRVWLLIPLLARIVLQGPDVPAWAHRPVEAAMVIGLAVQLALIGSVLVDGGVQALIDREKAARRDARSRLAGGAGVLRAIGMAVVLSIIALLALQNLGIEVTPLIAGLGVGGIAVALAAQNILGDLFASISILVDEPFVLGDFIIVGDKMGTVEHIGIKTTRVRALSGEQLVFGNTDLVASRIQNYKRMAERRVSFSLGVIYETPIGLLRRIPGMIEEAIKSQKDGVRFDRAHFKSFGAYSLDFEAVYFVLSPDYNRYMDIQQAINLALFEQFAQEGVDFAYPTSVEVVRPENGFVKPGRDGAQRAPEPSAEQAS